MNPYTYIWEFDVRPGREEEFEFHYGPDGTWVKLFRTADGYVETLLLRDLSKPRRYLTIDRWETEGAYRRFRRERATEFALIDEQCEALTVSEREIGRFEVVTAGR